MASEQTMCVTHPDQIDTETHPCLMCNPNYPELFIPFLYGNIRESVIREHLEEAFGVKVKRIGFGKMRQNKKNADGHSVYITIDWKLGDDLIEIRNDICSGEQYELEDVPGGKWLICKNNNCKVKKKRSPVLKKCSQD